MKLRALPIICVLLTGCPTTTTPGELITSSAPAAAASFVAGDVFEVRVFGEKELSGSFQVQEDGSIEFPLLGRVEIAGLTQAAAAKELETRLAAASQHVGGSPLGARARVVVGTTGAPAGRALRTACAPDGARPLPC